MDPFQVLPTPLAAYRRHGRIPEPSRKRGAHSMGLPVLPANRLRTRYAIFTAGTLKKGELTRTEHRCTRIRRDQQRGQRMEHDIHDRTACRLVLQRHRRLIRRRSVHWDYVRGQTLLLPRTSN